MLGAFVPELRQGQFKQLGAMRLLFKRCWGD
jgi:hypothetical protein